MGPMGPMGAMGGMGGMGPKGKGGSAAARGPAEKRPNESPPHFFQGETFRIEAAGPGGPELGVEHVGSRIVEHVVLLGANSGLHLKGVGER